MFATRCNRKGGFGWHLQLLHVFNSRDLALVDLVDLVWVVINTATVPLVIGVYVPHFGRHLSKHPIDARTVFDQLNKLLGSFPSSWIRVVQGDFNARLARNTPGVCGQWCSNAEENEMGVMLRELCEDNELIAQSTFFKPKRRKQGAGTHMPFGEKSAGKQSSTIGCLGPLAMTGLRLVHLKHANSSRVRLPVCDAHTWEIATAGHRNCAVLQAQHICRGVP